MAKILKQRIFKKHIVQDELNEEQGIKKQNPSSDVSNKKKSDNKAKSGENLNADGVIVTRSGKVVKCLNCEYSKKEVDTNHFLWNCPNLGYCNRCGVQHFPLGPDCQHKDDRLFNYDTYLEREKKKVMQKRFHFSLITKMKRKRNN